MNLTPTQHRDFPYEISTSYRFFSDFRPILDAQGWELSQDYVPTLSGSTLLNATWNVRFKTQKNAFTATLLLKLI